MSLFDSIQSRPSRSRNAQPSELTLTIEFLTVVVAQGARLSYAALADGAKVLGENASNQIAAQRGAALVKNLPEALQPFVCRKAGGYAKAVKALWKTETPADLTDRPVIIRENVARAIEIWQESLA